MHTRPTRRPSSLVSMLVVVVAVSACGTSPSTSQAPEDGPDDRPSASTPETGSSVPPEGQVVDACALLSDDEIEEITGYTVLTMTPTAGDAPGAIARCDWELDRAPDPCCGYVVVQVVSPYGRLEFDFRFLDEEDVQHISGLGDDAVQLSDQIVAVTGDTLVQVGAPDADMTRQLIEAALSNL